MSMKPNLSRQQISHMRIRVDSKWDAAAVERARAYDLAKLLARHLSTIEPLALKNLMPIIEKLTPEDPESVKDWPEFVIVPEVSRPGDLQPLPPPDVPFKARKCTKALMMLHEHPEWSDTEIARAVGCDRASLYRMKGFKEAKAMLKVGRKEFKEWDQGEQWRDED